MKKKTKSIRKLMGGRKIIEEKYILSETEEKDISFEGKNIA
ncbi:hypothetical protein [Acidilutibacter cellobiosedens]|nr:hypothetical protein [Acidilutibacter cellobiosedens]